LAAKPTGDLGKEKEKRDNPSKSADPFENPSTQDLFVKELTPTHSLMLNKFNIS
jgi:ATP adenylyltransferase/5',5'''-P-1,P-4-tetraphosphate phosphorylase II